MPLRADDKQRRIEKAVKVSLDSEQANNTSMESLDTSLDTLILKGDISLASITVLYCFNYLETVPKPVTRANGCGDLEFPSLIYSYYITQRWGKLPSWWPTSLCLCKNLRTIVTESRLLGTTPLNHVISPISVN